MLKHITLAIALGSLAAACAGSTPSTSTVSSSAPAPASEPTSAASASALPTEIIVAYDGQPVAPDYRQTYEITLTPAELRRTVHGPMQATSEQTVPVSAEQFAALVESMHRHGLAEQEASTDDTGCVGGASYRFAVTYPDRAPSRLSTYRCGGTSQGTLAGDIKGFASELNALLPAPPSGLPSEP